MWTLCKGSTSVGYGVWQSKKHDLVSLILLKRKGGRLFLRVESHDNHLQVRVSGWWPGAGMPLAYSV